MSIDVLLIQPPTLKCKRFTFNLGVSVPPTMLIHLAQPLLEKGFSADILDLDNYQIDGSHFKHYVEISRPAVVGITCTTATFSEALKTAAYVKSVDPHIKVVLGGPHVTFTAPETLANDCVDVVVRGEGDMNFPQLVEHYLRGKYSLAEIPGISYRRNGEIKENPRKIIADIDTLPFPRRQTIDLTRYSIPGTIVASRGCPFSCRFCASSAMAGGKYRIRSVENIMAEIDYLVTTFGINQLAFLDDTVTAYPHITQSLCRHLLERDYRIRWLCDSRVDQVDADLIRLMARAGCSAMVFGFESGSQRVLSTMKKGTTPQQIEDTVSICIDAGILPLGNFLIGFPEDTAESINETVQMAKKIKRKGSCAAIGVVTPFPGTYYYNHAKEMGITIHATTWDDYAMGHPIISTEHFTLDEIQGFLFDALAELDEIQSPASGGQNPF